MLRVWGWGLSEAFLGSFEGDLEEIYKQRLRFRGIGKGFKDLGLRRFSVDLIFRYGGNP